MTITSRPEESSNDYSSINITNHIDSSIVTYTSEGDTVTLGPLIITGAGAQPTYNFTGGSSIDTVTIDTSSFVFDLPKEWVDSFPDWARVQDMCKQYPGLEIAFRNFQTVYNLVKDDYDNPTPKK